MKLRSTLSAIFFCFVMLSLTNNAYAKTKLSVAAAGDLYRVLEDVKKVFENKYPDIELQFSFSSSGNLTFQIQQGAPYDVFLSADDGFPDRLQQLGLVDTSGPFLYTIGRISLWVRNDLGLNPANVGWKVLSDSKILSIAIANPKVAPYGRAAEAALHNVNYYDKIKTKLVFADNVAQAAQFLYTGSAEAGIISYSHATSPHLLKKGLVWVLPVNTYPALRQSGVILKYSNLKKQAQLFRVFLIGSEGQAIFAKYGFGKI